MHTTNYRDRNAALHDQWHQYQRDMLEAQAAGDTRRVQRIRRMQSNIEEQFLKANWGLITQAVRREKSSNEGGWYDDYIQIASVKVWELFPGWDPERGTFATFARKHLAGTVRKAVVRHERPLINYDDYTSRPKVFAAVNRLKAQRDTDRSNGIPVKSPTFAEIASEAGEGITVQTVKRLLTSSTTSLDAMFNDSQDLHDVVTFDDLENESQGSHSWENGSGDSVENETGAFVDTILGWLNARELYLISNRFGLDGQERKTHEQSGALIDGSRETSRPAVDKALDKILDKFEAVYGVELSRADVADILQGRNAPTGLKRKASKPRKPRTSKSAAKPAAKTTAPAAATNAVKVSTAHRRRTPASKPANQDLLQLPL